MKKESVFLNKLPNGEPMGNAKSAIVSSFCDEHLDAPPKLELVPAGLVLVAIVDNGGFEAALVCDNEHDHGRVHRAWSSGQDPRPVQFFLVKREWVRQMAEKPLISDWEGGE